MAPPATQRPFSRMRNSLATRRANGSFCSTSRTVTPVAIQLEDDVADLVHDVRLDAFGRFVEDEQRRFEDERAADRQLLLLAAGEIAAAPVEHLLEHGEQVEDLRRNRTGAVLPDAEADAQVLLDGQLREDLAALRHVADAEARARLGGQPGQARCRRTSISPDVTRSRPMMHLSSVVFPMPLRPIRHVREPAGTSRSTSHSVWLPPYDWLSALTASMLIRRDTPR